MSKLDPMVEVFLFEAEQLIESLEDLVLEGERQGNLNDEQINEVFRIMHTIKGSASMMAFENIAKLAHALEDLFSQIREGNAKSNVWDNLFDLCLAAMDLIKADITIIQAGENPEGIEEQTIDKIHKYMKKVIKGAGDDEEEDEAAVPSDSDALPEGAEEIDDIIDMGGAYYKIKVKFEDGCQMENMRAFSLYNTIEPLCVRIMTKPADLMDPGAGEYIIEKGFTMYILTAQNPDAIRAGIDEGMFIETASLLDLPEDSEEIPESMRSKRALDALRAEEEAAAALVPAAAPGQATAEIRAAKAAAVEGGNKANFISINVNKIDKLVDLIGEIVTTESMVTKNPDVVNLNIESFERSSQQLRKLINEMQDIIMSVRMIPISNTFHKMQRIVRDMCKKIGKEVELTIIGEETEVDKNMIDSLSDPLMHLIRNSVDHGIETAEVRVANGKTPVGHVTLEARNTGGDVQIFVTDDGKGLDRSTLIKKATERGINYRPESEISDKEAYNFIFAPGFSTKDKVTEFSGRGVGMDVVRRNIEKVSGTIGVDSVPGKGMTIQIKIPLTLAIIEGMKLRVGNLLFIVPMLSINESFKPNTEDVFLDPDGNEMIMIRGECFPILRLHEAFGIQSEFTNLEDGIIIMINTDNNSYCLFADELIGEQQAVIKPLPLYIQKHNTGLHGIGGCAVLGDGSISLIIDINSLVQEEN